MKIKNTHTKQRAFTLFEMMLAIVISTIIVMLGAVYVRSVYRGHLVNEAEQLIIQIITAAKNYHTDDNVKNAKDGILTGEPKKQYYNISTTWVANTGNIPGQYVQLGDDQKTANILSPWSAQPSIDVFPGSNSAKGDNTSLYIEVQNLPNYACASLAVRLKGELGGDRLDNQGVPVTQVQCDDNNDPDNNTLSILTKPLFY